MKDTAPRGWVRFHTLNDGETFHDVGPGGKIIQYIKVSPAHCDPYNVVDLRTGEHGWFDNDDFVYPVKAGWVAELECYGFKISEELEQEGHQAILAYVMSCCDSRKANDHWRAEIEKYLPQLGFMSFAGAQRTIRWLMDHVEIKPEYDAQTNKLKAIGDSDMPEDKKAMARIETMFPKLKGFSDGKDEKSGADS